jgi:hypothetical protein
MNNVQEAGTKKPTVNDTFDIPSALAHQQILDSMLQTVFFLPPEIMNNKDRYIIKRIELLTGHQAYKLLGKLLIAGGWNFHSDIDNAIMKYARCIGISMRYNRATGDNFLVAKLWYPSNPWSVATTQKGD